MKTLKNIEKKTPILFGLDKENQLKVPDGYFESIENKLLLISDVKPVIPLNYKKIFISISSIAAVLIIGFSIYQNNNTNQDTNTFNTTFNQLTIASFEEEMLDTDETDLPIDFEDTKELDININLIDEL